MNQHEQPEPRQDDVVFVWDDSWDKVPLADWMAANPSIGVPPAPASVEALDKVAHPPEPWTWSTVSEWIDQLAETDQRFALTDWQKWLLVEIGKRGRVDEQFRRIMFNARDRRQYRRAWLEGELASRAVTGQVFAGPAGVTYDECTEPLGWIDETVWAEVRPNPRNDSEMLNRVIDDLATVKIDMTTHIGCPKFPRTD